MDKIKRKNTIATLGIEVTRRCNMNCSFCARGKAQNVDVSKEIIDKTLDEIKANDIYICEIRFNGGEPMLNPEAVEYTIDGIIKRNLLVRHVDFFTNGMIRDEKIRNALIRFVEYRHSIESQIAIETYQQGFLFETVYNNAGIDGAGIVVSEYAHSNTDDDVKKCIEFYNYEDDYFTITRQTDTFSSIKNITISGNMLENYKQFYDKKVYLEQIRRIDNHYNFASKYMQSGKEKYLIRKAITVSANGNVFAGCISSYDDVDSEPMFNVLSCDGDFIDKIVQWCWKYPVSEKTKRFRENYEAVEWCEKHGITVVDVPQNVKKLMDILNVLTYREEQIALDVHEMCTNLDSAGIDALATAIFVMTMIEDDTPQIVMRKYLKLCTEYGEKEIAIIVGEKEKALNWIRNFIMFLEEKDRKLGMEFAR